MAKIIFITGANMGIGFEIVEALAASDQSYTVLLGGRSPEKLRNAVATVQKDFPKSNSQFFPVQADIEHDDSIERPFQRSNPGTTG